VFQLSAGDVHQPRLGSAEALARPNGNGKSPRGAAPESGGMSLQQLLNAIRQHRLLVLAVAALVGAGVTFLASRRPELYRAVATFRLPDARRALASEDGEVPAERSTDPLLSAVQVLTSRRSIGDAVDSMGLRLVPIQRKPFLRAPFARARIWRGVLREVRVDSADARDTLVVHFGRDRVVVTAGLPRAEAAYGRPIRLRIRHGSVRFVVAERPGVAGADAEVISRDRAIDRVLKQLKVAPRPSTDVVDVSYTGADPALARGVVNRLVQSFQASASIVARAQARRRRELLGERLQATEALLATAEAKLIAFQVRQPLASSSDRVEIERAVIAALNGRRGEVETDRRVYEKLLQRLESPNADEREEGLRGVAYLPEVASDRVLEPLHQQLQSYRGSLDSLTSGPWRSAPTNPDVLRLMVLVRSTQDEFVRALRSRLTAMETRSEVLASLSARGSQLMQSLPANQLQEARLKRRVEALQTSVEELRPQFEKARIAESLATDNIQILDLAPLPYRPVGVPAWLLLVCGLAFGLVVGTGAAVLAESMNARIRRPEDLLLGIGATGLGVIPKVSTVSPNGQRLRGLVDGLLHHEHRHAALTGPSTGRAVTSPVFSLGVEAFRMLRIRLAFGMGRMPRILLITSAAPQEGKTLVAANLAVTYAREGAKVLLVDGDIKRPRLHKLFRIPSTPGLMEMLRDKAAAAGPGYTFAPGISRGDVDGPLQAGIHRTDIDRLFVLPRGTVPSDPSALLQAARIESRLRQLATRFDVIIVDTPPVLVSADAATLAPAADGVILVVRAGQTHLEAAGLAYDNLTAAGAQIIGAVLNDPGDVVSRYQKFYYSYDYPETVE
jgi:polysaccharide biosynthesis transport protein